MTNKFKTILWNLYEDQVKSINLETLDGKSFSEFIRRIIDESKRKEHHLKFDNSEEYVNRPLKKVTIRVTWQQYRYLENVFPNRQKSKGLRFLVDFYLQKYKEES